MEFTSWDAGLHTGDQEYLAHYGVLGMKWGQRRFQKPDGSLTPAGQKRYAKTGEYGYQYHSHATKKYERKSKKEAGKALDAMRKGLTGQTKAAREKSLKKMGKHAEKSQKFKKRAERSAEIDRGEQEYAKNLSTGKAIAGTLLFGGNSMKGYAQYRSMAGQKGKNMSGQKVMAGIKALRAGSYGSRLAKAAYIRQDENKKTLGAKAYNVNKKVTDAGARILDGAAKTGGGWPDRDNSKKTKAEQLTNRIENNRKTAATMDRYRKQIVSEQGPVGAKGEAYGNYTKLYDQANRQAERDQKKLDKLKRRG